MQLLPRKWGADRGLGMIGWEDGIGEGRSGIWRVEGGGGGLLNKDGKERPTLS